MGTANSIVVYGTDVYVAGSVTGPSSGGLQSRATYWKNGIPIYLTEAFPDKGSTAKSILVNGTDVHVAGNIGEYGATYWKNGVAFPLGSGQGHAYSITIGK